MSSVASFHTAASDTNAGDASATNLAPTQPTDGTATPPPEAGSAAEASKFLVGVEEWLAQSAQSSSLENEASHRDSTTAAPRSVPHIQANSRPPLRKPPLAPVGPQARRQRAASGAVGGKLNVSGDGRKDAAVRGRVSTRPGNGDGGSPVFNPAEKRRRSQVSAAGSSAPAGTGTLVLKEFNELCQKRHTEPQWDVSDVSGGFMCRLTFLGVVYGSGSVRQSKKAAKIAAAEAAISSIGRATLNSKAAVSVAATAVANPDSVKKDGKIVNWVGALKELADATASFVVTYDYENALLQGPFTAIARLCKPEPLLSAPQEELFKMRGTPQQTKKEAKIDAAHLAFLAVIDATGGSKARRSPESLRELLHGKTTEPAAAIVPSSTSTTAAPAAPATMTPSSLGPHPAPVAPMAPPPLTQNAQPSPPVPQANAQPQSQSSAARLAALATQLALGSPKYDFVEAEPRSRPPLWNVSVCFPARGFFGSLPFSAGEQAAIAYGLSSRNLAKEEAARLACRLLETERAKRGAVLEDQPITQDNGVPLQNAVKVGGAGNA